MLYEMIGVVCVPGDGEVAMDVADSGRYDPAASLK
jgi:hypothetical protein